MLTVVLSIACILGLIINTLGGSKKIVKPKAKKILKITGWVIMLVTCILLLLIYFKVIPA